jgi:hypothetical protein
MIIEGLRRLALLRAAGLFTPIFLNTVDVLHCC